MGTYKDVLINHLDRILTGKEQFIPNPHVRMREVFNLHKGRYILVGSNSGTGKTSFVDDSLILKPYEWLRKQSFNYHFEVPYFSMERATRDKIAKWTSWKIFQDKGIRIPSNVFATGAQGDMRLSPELKALAESYEPWMEELLSKIDIMQGPKTVAEMRAVINNIAARICHKIHADDKNIFVNDKKVGEFGEPSKTIGNIKVPYRVVTIGEESVEITPNRKKFILKNPNTFVFPVFDHIGKTKRSAEHASKKAAIDDLDELASIARDDYYMSPILISQFNRAVGDITRIKFANGSLEPITDDFKDTGNCVESADLVISPFDPYRYSSFDKEGNYKGYNIADTSRPCTLTPSGVQRFRSIHIIKNSYGPNQLTYGMKFTGEVMDFKLLPPINSPELIKVYQDTMMNK